MTEPASFHMVIETERVTQKVRLVGGDEDSIEDVMGAYIDAIREGNLVDYA